MQYGRAVWYGTLTDDAATAASSGAKEVTQCLLRVAGVISDNEMGLASNAEIFQNAI